MNTVINLNIISGTDRPNSNAMRVSQYLADRYRAAGAVPGITDLRNFPVEHVSGGKYGEDIPEVEQFLEPIINSDGLVIVVPEYNGGYPGILKLMIDYMPFPRALDKKPIAFVGEATGAFGALRAVEQLQMVVGYRNAHVFPERVFIPRIHENFDPERGISDPAQQELLNSQIENFVSFMEQVKGETSLSG